MARNMFADEPETTGEELDLRKLFLRFLEKDDWTDKLALGFGKIRGRIHRPQRDTKLSKELRLLVPDMKEVEKAYVEMTSGYKAKRHGLTLPRPRTLRALIYDLVGLTCQEYFNLEVQEASAFILW